MYVQAPEQKGNNQMKCQKPKKWWKLFVSTMLLPNCFKYN